MASAARLFAVFTALSVNVPSCERCVRPPLHVNAQAAMFGEFSGAGAAFVFQVE